VLVAVDGLLFWTSSFISMIVCSNAFSFSAVCSPGPSITSVVVHCALHFRQT